jgi:hypothetical protein
MEQMSFDEWYDEHQVELEEDFLNRKDDYFSEISWEDFLIDLYEDYLVETTGI